MMLHTKILLTIGTLSLSALALPSQSYAEMMEDCIGGRYGFSCEEGGGEEGSEGPHGPDDPKYENPGTKSPPKPRRPVYTLPSSDTLKSSPTHSPGLAPP
jgi:hypothetical protein